MTDLHVGVALDGYGWHPQAWRYTLARDPAAPGPFSGRYWAELAKTAESGLLDFVSFDDALTPQSGRRSEIDPSRVAGRADAVLVAARVAPATQHIGLIPVATVTHTEPFHVSKAIASLDFVSHGRAGWQPRVTTSAHEAALFGRRYGSGDTSPVAALQPSGAISPVAALQPSGAISPVAALQPSGDVESLFEEAADVVEVVRRLWDSWEDDAVIRDVATGRFVDRDKLHYIDFAGKYFSVKGPSITPRPPQGQPVIAVLAHAPRVYEFAAASADIVFVTPTGEDSLRSILAEVSEARGAAARPLSTYADLVVSLVNHPLTSAALKSDAHVFAGTATELAGILLSWHDLGVDGVRLRPAVTALDLPAIVDDVVPLLQRAGRFRSSYRDGETLRERLGLAPAPNRYAASGAGT